MKYLLILIFNPITATWITSYTYSFSFEKEWYAFPVFVTFIGYYIFSIAYTLTIHKWGDK